jgi:hypothetical protein
VTHCTVKNVFLLPYHVLPRHTLHRVPSAMPCMHEQALLRDLDDNWAVVAEVSFAPHQFAEEHGCLAHIRPLRSMAASPTSVR